MPSRGNFLPGLPGLPGLAAPGHPAPPVSLPDLSGAQNFGGNFPAPPPPFPGGMPPLPPGMDLEALRQAFGGQLPPPPGIGGGANGGMPPFPLPPAGFPALPAGFVPPPGFPPPSSLFPGAALPIMPAGDFDGGFDNKRRRAPLPSQQDSLKEEMKLGRYVKPR
jgi:polyadenylation factor subunit 2